MAVDIDAFKRDLDQLKNQRSVIQAKLDEANHHVEELKSTLAGMGFNSVDEAKQAYVKQLQEAEAQHNLVKKLIEEISQVDSKVPTREEVAARLNSFGANQMLPLEVSTSSDLGGNVAEPAKVAPVVPVVPVVPVQPAVNVVPQQVSSDVTTSNPVGNNDMDLGGLLFANL